jgi:hypothetical protein
MIWHLTVVKLGETEPKKPDKAGKQRLTEEFTSTRTSLAGGKRLSL